MSYSSMPLVSIIIPAYNAGKYFEEALQSAMLQTYKHTEIIIVDDGSTDNTLDIAKRFQQQYSNIYIYTQQNKGACVARNFGFEKSKGDFIQFFDADDLMDADKIEKQIEQLLNHPNCLSTCKWLRFRSKIEEPIGGVGPYHSIQQNLSPTNWLLENQMMVLHAWLSPRNIIEKCGGWDEGLTVNQDGEFFYRVVALSSKVLFQNNTTVYYRNPSGSGNVSKINMYHKYESLFKAALSYKKIVNQITQNSIEGKRVIGDYFRQLVYNYFYPNYKELLLKCIEQEEYHISTLEPKLTGVTKKIGKLFGWRLALSLKQKVSKYIR